MSGLFASLESSVKALTAHSRSIEIAGKNLANVNNTAYARQRVIYGDRGTVVTPTGAESLGLEALGVEQIRDTLLDRQVMREISLSGSFSAEQGAYQRAQAGLGQSIDRSNAASATGAADDKGLAAALDDFFNAFQSFAASPTDEGERQALVQSAGILTDRFQLADQRVGQVQTDVNAGVANDVDDVKRLLKTIADLNGQISRFEVNAPGSAVDLRDQRQARLEELAAKLPVEIQRGGAGEDQLVTKDATGADVVLIDGGNVLGTVAFDSTQPLANHPVTFTGSAGTVQLDPVSGSIKGALTARDGAIQSVRDDLNNLARQLVTSVNGAYGADFFTAAGTSAGTISVASSVTAASLKAGDPAFPGDNSIATAVAGLATTTFSTAGGATIDGTFATQFSKTVSKLGQALSSANSRTDDQSNIERLVRSQRDSVSGVSLDEEMADLMKYQRAFQASSRVFTVIDDLLDVVVNRLGTT